MVAVAGTIIAAIPIARTDMFVVSASVVRIADAGVVAIMGASGVGIAGADVVLVTTATGIRVAMAGTARVRPTSYPSVFGIAGAAVRHGLAFTSRPRPGTEDANPTNPSQPLDRCRRVGLASEDQFAGVRRCCGECPCRRTRRVADGGYRYADAGCRGGSLTIDRALYFPCLRVRPTIRTSQYNPLKPKCRVSIDRDVLRVCGGVVGLGTDQ